MTISATTQGLRMGVATSSSRPTVPFDGQVISETDTDSLKVYNGTAWTGISALTPVIPTSIIVGGGSGSFSTSTGTVTATGVTTIMLNGVFTSKYNAYKVLFQGSATTNSNMRMRFCTGGVENSAASYAYSTARLSYAAGTFSAYGYGTADTYFIIGDIMPTATSTTTTMMLDVGSPFTAAYTSATSHSARDDYSFVFGGNHKSTTSFDGIWFNPSTLPMTVTITVYGYNT